MHIDNTYLNNYDAGKNSQAAQTAEAAKSSQAAGVNRAAENRPSLSVQDIFNPPGRHIPSPELLKYHGLLLDTPEVRNDRVKEVAAKLKQGYYSTPEAANQTADAILRAAE